MNSPAWVTADLIEDFCRERDLEIASLADSLGRRRSAESEARQFEIVSSQQSKQRFHQAMSVKAEKIAAGAIPDHSDQLRHDVARFAAIVPEKVAKSQATWELCRRICRARSSGATLNQVATVLGISSETARKMAIKHLRKDNSVPPLVKYFADMSDIMKMSAL